MVTCDQQEKIAVKHLSPFFLTTLVQHKYLQALATTTQYHRNRGGLVNAQRYCWETWGIQIQKKHSNLHRVKILCILHEEGNKRPTPKFTSSTKLKSNSPFSPTITKMAKPKLAHNFVGQKF